MVLLLLSTYLIEILVQIIGAIESRRETE